MTRHLVNVYPVKCLHVRWQRRHSSKYQDCSWLLSNYETRKTVGVGFALMLVTTVARELTGPAVLKNPLESLVF